MEIETDETISTKTWTVRDRYCLQHQRSWLISSFRSDGVHLWTMLFCLIYSPCVGTLAMIRSESKSVKFTVLSLVYGLVLAWVVSFVFYQGVNLFI